MDGNMAITDVRSISATKSYTLDELCDASGSARERRRVGVRRLRQEIRAGKLRAARLNDRGDFIVLGSWWLEYLERLAG